MAAGANVGLQGIPLELGYSSGYGSLVERFYQPCLKRAICYDRAVGYFRSSFYAITAVAYTDFVERGGSVRLVCSPRLTDEDWAAVQAGYSLKDRGRERIRRTLDSLLDDEIGTLGVRFLACLISSGALDIRIAVPRKGRGVFHEKLGVFKDQAHNKVSFIGSSNETYMAWDEAGNYESFEVFPSWKSPESRDRTERHAEYFDELWSGSERPLRVFRLPEEIRSVLIETGEGTTLLEAQQKFADRIRQSVRGREGHRTSAREMRPYTLQEHQLDSVEAWSENDCRGIIKHATGAGKTVTALEIVKRWVDQGRPAIITVPTIVLQEQWRVEIARHLSDVDFRLLLAGGESSRSRWKNDLTDFTYPDPDLGPRIILSLIHTASSDAFLRSCRDGDHLLVVSDEVHVTGAPTFQRLFKLAAGGRLGLSATPERYGDPDGTQAIHNFFGRILKPVISLQDAIAAGRLVPYYYHVHSVRLTSDEQEEWNELSVRIAKEYASLPDDEGQGKQFTERLKFLLIKRARILKQAAGKVRLARRVVSNHYKKGERWLVYCDDTNQLDEIRKTLRADGHDVVEYHSAMESDREAVMSYFGNNACILVAIKCLDEGVDVPNANAALILASSSNPREFIQRRGRVLRRSDRKNVADVHDAVVLPNDDGAENEAMQEGILGTELRRALIFAEGASNQSCEIDLREMARATGMNLDQLDSLAFESDETDQL